MISRYDKTTIHICDELTGERLMSITAATAEILDEKEADLRRAVASHDTVLLRHLEHEASGGAVPRPQKPPTKPAPIVRPGKSAPPGRRSIAPKKRAVHR